MGLKLNPPTDWKDHTLIEADNDQFLYAEFGAQTYVSRTRSDVWTHNIVKQIIDNSEYRTSALRWVDFAFKPEPGMRSPAFGGPNSDLDAIEVFVKFYWEWHSSSEEAAFRVLSSERRKRKFVYQLPGMESAMIPVKSSSSRRVRKSKPRRAEENLAADINDETVATVVVQAGLPSEAQPIFALESDPEDEKDEVTAFSDGKDVSGDIEIQGATTHDAYPVIANAHSSAASSGPSTAVDNTARSPLKPARSHRKKSRGGAPTCPSRQSLYRAASKRDRLTAICKAEASYDMRKELTAVPAWDESAKKRQKLSDTSGSPRSAPSQLPATSSSTSGEDCVPLPRGGPRGKPRDNKPGPKAEKAKLKKAQRATRRTSSQHERRAKRRKDEEDHNAFHVLNNAIQAQDVLRAAPAPVELAHGTSVAAPSNSVSSKRARGEEISVDVINNSTPAFRKVAKLPKKTSARKRLKDLNVPRPALNCLGIPASLLEADAMLRETASNGLLDLTDKSPQAGEWPEGSKAQDSPPTSDDEDEDDEEDVPPRLHVKQRGFAAYEVDIMPLRLAGSKAEDSSLTSDEEEDVPLRLLVQQRAETTHEEAVISLRPPLSSRTRLSEYLLESTIPGEFLSTFDVSAFASCSALSPPPSPDGKRVPIPTPPPVPKQPLTKQPTIWATSRQEVCESWDYFRCYQSGVYFNNDIAKGYLLSQFSASRDLFAQNGRLIISHGGGKAESLHSDKGKPTMHDASDQLKDDKSVRALMKTHTTRRPIALLIDDRYALFPYDLASKKDCTYAVLGFYHIAHVWAERQSAGNSKGFVVRYKFAFKWCENQPAPWWLDEDANTSDHPKSDNSSSQGSALWHQVCHYCGNESPHVYQEGWMCLQPHCQAFWTFPDGSLAPEDLTYAESFLDVSTPCEHETLEDIAPSPPTIENCDGVVTSRRFSRGWHCKKCGRLSSRFHWQYWECKNCGERMTVDGKLRDPKEFWGQKNDRFLHHQVLDRAIQVSNLMPCRTEDGRHAHYHIYTLPENRGKIYLVFGQPLGNTIPNKIFEEYQDQAKSGKLQFRRYPLKSHQCRGELLTNYFSQNSGEPYQYVGGNENTVPFDVAPSAVVQARDFIHSRMMSVMQAEKQPYHFNEVLSAAYMEAQSMSFHSDAEVGLGPRVASLSLGSAAYMHFRLLKKYRPIAQKAQRHNALTLFLRHGDVVIMDGAGVQTYYEHTVVPVNFRIAATARYIGPTAH